MITMITAACLFSSLTFCHFGCFNSASRIKYHVCLVTHLYCLMAPPSIVCPGKYLISNQCCFNVAPPSSTLAEHLVIGWTSHVCCSGSPNKHMELNQYWFNSGPSSTTLVVHHTSIGLTPCVCWYSGVGCL